MPTHRTSSPSPSSHKRASEDQSLDSHSNRSYSDSFDSDESDTETATIKSQGRNGRQTSGKRRSMKQQKSIYGKKWRGGGGGSTRTKASGGHDTKMDAVAQRMKSARRKNTNALKNALEVAQQEAAEMHNENKTLKRQMHLSEKVLDKYVAAENDMGSIMSRHTEAMRSLKEQVRKHKDKASKATQKLKATEEDLDKTQRMLKKMKGLVDDSELDERDKLARKLHKYEDKLEASEKRVSDLDKYKDNLQKNNRHEIGIERARFKDTKRQLDVITSEMERLKTQLREKEKEIDVHNIYSMRLMKPPHRLNSVNSSPMASRASYVRQRKNSDPPSSCPTPHGGVLERNRLRALRLEEEEEEANNRELQRQQRERETSLLYEESIGDGEFSQVNKVLAPLLSSVTKPYQYLRYGGHRRSNTAHRILPHSAPVHLMPRCQHNHRRPCSSAPSSSASTPVTASSSTVAASRLHASASSNPATPRLVSLTLLPLPSLPPAASSSCCSLPVLTTRAPHPPPPPRTSQSSRKGIPEDRMKGDYSLNKNSTVPKISANKGSSPEPRPDSSQFFITQHSVEEVVTPLASAEANTPAPQPKPRPQTPQREESIPMFDVNKGQPNAQFLQQETSSSLLFEDTKPLKRIEREESVPLFDLKGTNKKTAATPEPVVLKSNPRLSDKVYRSYKDPLYASDSVEEDTGTGYKPTWLATSNNKSTAKKAAPLSVI